MSVKSGREKPKGSGGIPYEENGTNATNVSFLPYFWTKFFLRVHLIWGTNRRPFMDMRYGYNDIVPSGGENGTNNTMCLLYHISRESVLYCKMTVTHYVQS